MSIKEILEKLPKLTPEERKEIRDAARRTRDKPLWQQHVSAKGELRHRKTALEPGIISSGWIGIKATCPSRN